MILGARGVLRTLRTPPPPHLPLQYVVQNSLAVHLLHTVYFRQSTFDESEKPTLKNVLKVLQNKVSNKWEDIGIQLDIDDGQLSQIKTDNAGDSKACLREMLRAWLKRANPLPSWSEMIEALESQGNEDIASQIKDKYNCT